MNRRKLEQRVLKAEQQHKHDVEYIQQLEKQVISLRNQQRIGDFMANHVTKLMKQHIRTSQRKQQHRYWFVMQRYIHVCMHVRVRCCAHSSQVCCSMLYAVFLAQCRTQDMPQSDIFNLFVRIWTQRST